VAFRTAVLLGDPPAPYHGSASVVDFPDSGNHFRGTTLPLFRLFLGGKAVNLLDNSLISGFFL
jgi:hypothetical protein